MKRLEYKCRKEENKPFKIINGTDLKVQLNLLPPGDFTLTVQKEYKKASHKQFKWLYGDIYPKFMEGLNDAGYEFTTIDEVDMFAKSMWANKEVLNMETGEIRTMPMSKAEFLTIDHAAFVANIRYYAAQYLNTIIPEPDVDWKLHKIEVQQLINKQHAA